MPQGVNATNVGLSPLERNRLINALRNVLDNGIVDQETYQEIRSGRLPAIRFHPRQYGNDDADFDPAFGTRGLCGHRLHVSGRRIPQGYRAHGHVAVSCKAT